MRKKFVKEGLSAAQCAKFYSEGQSTIGTHKKKRLSPRQGMRGCQGKFHRRAFALVFNRVGF